MSNLLTMAEARSQLRLEEGDDDAAVALLVAAASEIVLDFVTDEDAEDWTDATAPGEVKAAARLILTELYDNRGASSDPLSPSVRALLWRHRDPSLA